MITEKITWAQYRAMVFAKIGQLVEDSNCSNYSVLGYKYLDTKLILHYSDCDRVFTFQYNPIDENHTNEDLDMQFEETSFYTKDYSHEEYLKGLNHFIDNWDSRVPEDKNNL
jgi:hypothetical protein